MVAARIALALASLIGAAPAVAETLDASVGCRDGEPNGMYELRGADGGLRVAGALARGRRTGTFVFWSARGARVAVVPYDNDEKVGTVALWYAPRGSATEGRRKLEAPYAAGRRNGVTRSWYEDGRPRGEYRYEHGALAEAHAWRRGGAELPEREARVQAERDAAADDILLRELEALVAANVPACQAESVGIPLSRSGLTT